MKHIFLLFQILILSTAVLFSQKTNLINGDLLFCIDASNSSDFSDAIINATAKDNLSIVHVGIVYIDKENETSVIHASSEKGVIVDKLQDFVYKYKISDDKYSVIAKRLIPEYQYCIPKAISKALGLIGCAYDNYFDINNNLYYCSELVSLTYKDSSNNYIFPPIAMSFKNQATKEFDEFWIKHFEKLNTAIPEGEPGTNPADMFKSDKLILIRSFY